MKGTARTSAPLSWLGFLIPVVVVPSVLGVCWHYRAEIGTWIQHNPWTFIGGVLAAVVTGLLIILADTYVRFPKIDHQCECCTDHPEGEK